MNDTKKKPGPKPRTDRDSIVVPMGVSVRPEQREFIERVAGPNKTSAYIRDLIDQAMKVALGGDQ